MSLEPNGNGVGGARAGRILAAAVAGAVLAASGCAHPQTTRLTTDDFVAASSDMAAQLRQSPLIKERTPDSPRMVIAIQRVENLTSDLMSEGERWLLMDRVRNSLAVRDLAREKNLAFVSGIL